MNDHQQGYPKPTVPISPLPSLPSFFSRNKTDSPYILDGGGRVDFVTSGRVAIARALQMAGVTAGAQVLVPAYHCPSMVAPINWMNAVPIYYECDTDLTPVWSDLEAKATDKTRAMIVVHYFGFAQPHIEKLARFCTEHEIELIEDCAHAMFGQHNQQTIGSFGQHAIASPVKFFPIFDGGLHINNSDSSDGVEALSSPPKSFELKALLNPLERSVEYQRFFPFNWILKFLFKVKDYFWNRQKLKTSAHLDDTHASAALSSAGPKVDMFSFDAAWLNTRMSLSSRLSLKFTSKHRIVERRRDNYQQLLAVFTDIDGCKPLFDTLPETFAPYVFPLLVNNAAAVHHKLMSEGVPIYRWDALYSDNCAVSNRYSIELFQFPCHQELTKNDLNWIVSRVLNALNTNDS